MPKCQNCEKHLTKQFVRVFGDNENKVHKCHDCMENVNTTARDMAGLQPVRQM